jgi:translation initiation factor IF-2
MPSVAIKKLAEQIGISGDKLLQQLDDAGIQGKGTDGTLDDAERDALLGYLRGGKTRVSAEGVQHKVTLSRRTTSAIKQNSRTGPSRTVHVEVKKRRTYVRRGELQRQQEEAQQDAREEEEARQREQAQAEAEAQARIVAAEEEKKKAEDAAKNAAAGFSAFTKNTPPHASNMASLTASAPTCSSSIWSGSRKNTCR